jgi:hypothetical protein
MILLGMVGVTGLDGTAAIFSGVVESTISGGTIGSFRVVHEARITAAARIDKIAFLIFFIIQKFYGYFKSLNTRSDRG